MTEVVSPLGRMCGLENKNFPEYSIVHGVKTRVMVKERHCFTVVGHEMQGIENRWC